jgi:hypothetical protein
MLSYTKMSFTAEVLSPNTVRVERSALESANAFIMPCKVLAETYCLHAAKTTNSGPSRPINIHFKFRSQNCATPCCFEGMLRWRADQTQRPMVRKHDVMIENVPRLGSSGTQPTVTIVDFVVPGSGSPYARCIWTDSIDHDARRTLIIGRLRVACTKFDGRRRRFVRERTLLHTAVSETWRQGEDGG